MINKKHILALCSLLVVFAMPLGAQAVTGPTIRVAIVRDIAQVTVRPVRGQLDVRMASGLSRKMSEASIRAMGEGLRLNGDPVAGDELIVEGQPAAFYIGKSMYRGVIHVYVEGQGRLLVVDVLDLEDYLAGLINSEISSNWPIEAVKAQAVAARTYALYQVGGTNRHAPMARYDVESTVADQVYHGAHREDKRAYEGVRATTGQVLTRDGVLFPAFYHSTCGGHTERAQNVWLDMTSDTATVDKYCQKSPYASWFLRIERPEFIAILTRAGMLKPKQLLERIGQVPFADSPRADEVILYTDSDPAQIKATELRKTLGYKRLKSTWFNVGIEGDAVVFAGRGFGHGVGLCQWGAKGMAEAGYNYKEILKHYYRHAEIGRMY